MRVRLAGRPSPMHIGLALLAAALLADVAWADEPTEEPKGVPIDLEVQIAHASNAMQPARFDPACDEIRRRVPMEFSSYAMLRRERMQLHFGERGRMSLPTGRELELVPISVVHGRLHLHFRMKDVMDTRLQMVNGHPFIVGGESYESGRLIIMIKPDFRPYLPQTRPERPESPLLQRVNQGSE